MLSNRQDQMIIDHLTELTQFGLYDRTIYYAKRFTENHHESVELRYHAHMKLGEVYEKMCDHDTAQRAYRAAEKLEPSLPRRVVAETSSKVMTPVEPEKTIVPEKPAELDDTAKALEQFSAGLSLHHKKDYTNAIICFNKAIQLNPQHARAHSFLGYCYYLLKNYDEVIKCSTLAISLEPDHSINYHYRSLVSLYQGKLNEALADCNKAIELSTLNTIDHLYLSARGEVLYKLGKFNESITDCTTAIGSNADNLNAYLYRGRAYIKLRRFKEAIDDFSKVIELNKTDPVYFTIRADAYFALGNFSAVVTDCSTAIGLKADYSNVYKLRALAYFKLRRFKEAIADHTKTIELEPSNGEHYLNRAAAYHQTGQPVLAFADERKAQQLIKLPSLKDMCKFFILNNHGRVLARNAVRHFVQHTEIDFATDRLRRVLEESAITPDTIELTRKEQGLITGTSTLFDEIRKEEEFYQRCEAASAVPVSSSPKLTV